MRRRDAWRIAAAVAAAVHGWLPGTPALAGRGPGLAAGPDADWPHVRALDRLAEEGDLLVADQDAAALRAFAPRLAAGARAAADAPIPGAAAGDRTTLAWYQQELKGLADLLDAASDLDPADLRNAVAAVHPLVLAMMRAAGMAQVHDHADHGHAPRHEHESNDPPDCRHEHHEHHDHHDPDHGR